MSYRFFTQRDFDTASPRCSIEDMDSSFMHKLDLAREYSLVPYIVNSGYRTLEHETKKDRDGTSSHTKGIAVDLKAENSRTRFLILQGLLKAGFTRIGVGSDFVHVDGDTEKDQQVIWHYYT